MLEFQLVNLLSFFAFCGLLIGKSYTKGDGASHQGMYSGSEVEKDEILDEDPKAWATPRQKKQCWGYEKNCDRDTMMFRSQCRKNPENTYNRRQSDFWRYADWGYVAYFRNSMKDVCSARGKSDSSLRCSADQEICVGRNLYMDFRKFQPGESGANIFSKGQVGGRCKYKKENHVTGGEHKSVLMSWITELESFSSLKFKPSPTSEDCDVWVDTPTVFMKMDAGVNIYHHFCDFFNLYASQHVNGSFSRDLNIVRWETGHDYYYDIANATWEVFSKAPVKRMDDYRGQRVCFREVMFSLLPRMRLGLFYSTPLPAHCSGSGLFHAFNRHLMHRLHIKQERKTGSSAKQREGSSKRLRVTFLSRKTAWRRAVNEDELIAALRETGKYDVYVANFTIQVPFIEQMRVMYNTDVLVGMHGAGLAHTLFLPDWAALFELYNCNDINCYKDLAALRGVKYVTWQRVDKLKVVERSPDHLDSAVEKFSNYRFDVAEFMHLVEEAAKSVRARLRL